MTLINRIGAACGLAGVPLAAAAVILVDPASPLEASPSGSSELAARALADNADSAMAGAWCGLAAALLLTIFFARLHGGLRTAAGPDSWLPQIALMVGATFIAMQLVGVAFAFAASDTDSFTDDHQVAMILLVFGWYFPAVFAPCMAAVMASVTAVAFTSDAFPAWFAWIAAALLSAVVLITASGAAGMAAAAGFFALLFVAVVLTVRRDQSADGSTRSV